MIRTRKLVDNVYYMLKELGFFTQNPKILDANAREAAENLVTKGKILQKRKLPGEQSLPPENAINSSQDLKEGSLDKKIPSNKSRKE
jgi:hypothetical protein